MQSGLGRPAARTAGWHVLRCGRLYVLLLSFAAAGCANVGQIGNLTEGRRAHHCVRVGRRAAPAVFHKFVRTLKEEAGARQITVVSAGQADYRLRGYLAAHPEGATTSIVWVWDVYGAGQRRAFRLRGEDKGVAGANAWAAADDQTLRRIAQTGIEQLALFIATARPRPAPRSRRRRLRRRNGRRPSHGSTIGRPRRPGIFRIFRRGPQPEITADARPTSAAGEVPLPKGRPAPGGAPSSPRFAFAPND